MSTATAATSLRLCSGSVDSNAVADSVVLSATTSSTLDAFKNRASVHPPFHRSGLNMMRLIPRYFQAFDSMLFTMNTRNLSN